MSASKEMVDGIRPLLYPNPTIDYLMVEKLPETGYHVEVMDFQGNRKWSGSLESGAKLSLEGWSAGVYALQLISENETIAYSFVKI
ncbi:MAG: T9SS type A sorting domain-containing protein [Saprospiraceae bacterium]|nr:T9SS type A sorting domain-containing protein [Saprospiraceae bacterium]